MKISVIIPTRHRNDPLAQCLDRLVPGVQTLPADQYEVIVTDDGSVSTAEAMVQERYPWARWVAGPRRGPAANRNNGAAQAKGDWLAFTDDDCLPMPGWLQGYADAAANSDALVFEGVVTSDYAAFTAMVNAPVNGTGGFLWSCNFMIRASLFEETRFDESFPVPAGEDADLRQRLVAKGIKFPFVAAAEVVHPPRRHRFGADQAKLHESAFVAWRKANLPPPPLLLFLARLTRDRLRNIARHRFCWDTGIAMASAFCEVLAAARCYGKWRRQYRRPGASEGAGR